MNIRGVIGCWAMTSCCLLAACGTGGSGSDNQASLDVLQSDTADAVDVAREDRIEPGDTADAVDPVDVEPGDDGVATDTTVAGCNLVVLPESTSYGTTQVGSPVTRQVRLVNSGVGVCKVTSVVVSDCPDNATDEPVCPASGDAVASSIFTIVSDLPGAEGIEAGASFNLQVRFDPTETDPDVGPAGQRWAILFVTVQDDESDLQTVIPDCGGPCQPNMVGYAGLGEASFMPAVVDFGVVSPGCASTEHPVCIYNTGVVPLSLDSVSIVACGEEFTLLPLLSFPEYIEAGSSMCLRVAYAPSGVGDDECVMTITLNGAAKSILRVPIKGSSIADSEQVDQFIQARSDAVDILFVLDDSGSMCDEQAVLLDAFENFIEYARIWDNDFHIGVINVDAVTPGVAGHLNLGDRADLERYLGRSTTIVEDFAAMADIGCDGSTSEEAGLHAALTALMPPLTTDTTVVCGKDTDCSSNPVICPDPADCPYICVQETCAGFNKGFLRDDARLEVIVLSDEDDQSLMPVPGYVQMLQDLKAGRGEGQVHFNAIVGVQDVPLPGDEYSACTSPTGSTAVAGTRYIEAAGATGGVVGSICEGSFDTVMNDIAQQAFTNGGRMDYFLSRVADSSTIQVSLQRFGTTVPTPCSDGWEYVEARNSVVLDAAGNCVPEADDMVIIGYQVLCLND